jgi:LOR/SDH bifunctional enzyme conserved region
VSLSGHLFDKFQINKALDIIEAAGGSFHLIKCEVGRSIEDFSYSELEVSYKMSCLISASILLYHFCLRFFFYDVGVFEIIIIVIIIIIIIVIIIIIIIIIIMVVVVIIIIIIMVVVVIIIIIIMVVVVIIIIINIIILSSLSVSLPLLLSLISFFFFFNI